MTGLTIPLGLRVALALHVGGPQGQVVPEQLHDQSRVLVTLLRQRVQLSYGVIKSRLGETIIKYVL